MNMEIHAVLFIKTQKPTDRAAELCILRKKSKLVIVIPRTAGVCFTVNSLNCRSCSPIFTSVAFMMMFIRATEAQALLVVCEPC